MRCTRGSSCCRSHVVLAVKEHVQSAVAFLAQRKPHSIGVALGGKPAASVGVTEIAARLQFFLIGPRALVTWRGTRARPSRAQGKPLRKRPVGLESLFWHEERAGHKILVRRGGPQECNAIVLTVQKRRHLSAPNLIEFEHSLATLVPCVRDWRTHNARRGPRGGAERNPGCKSR